MSAQLHKSQTVIASEAKKSREIASSSFGRFPRNDGRKWRHSNQRGVVLITVLILLLTIALLGVSLAEFFLTVKLSSDSIRDQAQASYLAEAGIAHGINFLRHSAGQEILEQETIGPVALGDGSYTVTFDREEQLIVTTGNVHGTQKKLQLRYQLL